MEKFAAIIGATVLVVAVIVGLGLLLAWPTELLWNGCLIGAVDGVHEITLFQAWGLNVLFGIMFKNATASSK